jgi:hypothetical protein
MGLQNPVHRFDSGRRLSEKAPHISRILIGTRAPIRAGLAQCSGVTPEQTALAAATERCLLSRMATRSAACTCGQLRLSAEGDPVVVYVCHCQACQRRTGSAFGSGARFQADAVQVEGDTRAFERESDGGVTRTFHFCPICGATVFATTASVPGFITVFVGAFADPTFPPPTVSLFEARRHPWVQLPDTVEPG